MLVIAPSDEGRILPQIPCNRLGAYLEYEQSLDPCKFRPRCTVVLRAPLPAWSGSHRAGFRKEYDYPTMTTL